MRVHVGQKMFSESGTHSYVEKLMKPSEIKFDVELLYNAPALSNHNCVI